MEKKKQSEKAEEKALDNTELTEKPARKKFRIRLKHIIILILKTNIDKLAA